MVQMFILIFFYVAPCKDSPIGSSILSIKSSTIAAKFSPLDFCMNREYASAFKCTSKKLIFVQIFFHYQKFFPVLDHMISYVKKDIKTNSLVSPHSLLIAG